MKRFTVLFSALVISMLCSATLAAQSAAEHMLLGDQAELALKPGEALQHYDAIIASDSNNVEALWKASKNALDLGEFEKDKKKQELLYRKGELLGKRAVALKPDNADARFHLARALGVVAMSVGVRERVKYAKEIRLQALECLKLQPGHSGALHVLAVWNAEVMRLSGIERTLAKAFLGGGFFSEASWDDAIKYIDEAVAAEPDRIVHYLDQARIYRDRKMFDKARVAYQHVVDGKSIYCSDDQYKRIANTELARLKKSDSDSA